MTLGWRLNGMNRWDLWRGASTAAARDRILLIDAAAAPNLKVKLYLLDRKITYSKVIVVWLSRLSNYLRFKILIRDRWNPRVRILSRQYSAKRRRKKKLFTKWMLQGAVTRRMIDRTQSVSAINYPSNDNLSRNSAVSRGVATPTRKLSSRHEYHKRHK